MCKLGCGITALNSILMFTGNSTFLSNKHNNLGSSEAGAGAILAVASSLHFTGTNNFSNNFYNSINEVGISGAIHTTNNTVLAFHGTINFINNSAGNDGGAIFASHNTVLTFTGTNNFIDNHVNNGDGGTIRTSTLGGAIYVADVNPFIYCTPITPYIPREKCFFQLHNQNLSNGLDMKLTFENNSADDAGSVLYGGAIDNCKLTDLDSYSSGEVFNMLFNILWARHSSPYPNCPTACNWRGRTGHALTSHSAVF